MKDKSSLDAAFDAMIKKFSNKKFVKNVESVLKKMENKKIDSTDKIDLTNDIQFDIEEIERLALEKPYVKYKKMQKSYNPTMYDTLDHKYIDQINALWQELKKMEAQVALASTMLKQQDIAIKELTEKLNTKDSDQIQEINDRIDDLESRIDLIDE